MSNITYNKEWRSVQDYLSNTLTLEPSQADRRQQRKLLATLYVRYIQIANRLSECVDQTIQAQKVRLIRKLLEAVLGRIIELKSDLVEADLCDYTYLGEIYDDLKITPLEGELEVPSCFRLERKQELDERSEVIDGVLKKLGFMDRVIEKVTMTEAQAILVIQVHERARQGRLRAQFMREIKSMKEKSKPAQDQTEDEKEVISLPAALRIQKIWRGYIARRQTKRRKLQEMLLIGMVAPPQVKQNKDLNRAKAVRKQRRTLQEERKVKYEEVVDVVKKDLEKNQRGVILEQLGDQVRNWLREYRASTGKIPEYTTSERSTSRLLMSRQGTESELSKSTQVSSKESKTKKSKTKKEEKDAEEEDETISKAIISNFVPELNTRKEEYDEVWKNKNEYNNKLQNHYMNMIQEEQTSELENELKKVVDEMMKAELLLLQDALDKDRGHKGKKPKKAGKKTRKGGKKGKKKKEKDLTPDRTTESLLEELVANGIIKPYPKTHFADYKGELSYWNPSCYNQGPEQRVSLGDLRQILREYCVLPMLTPQLHESTGHVKSLLLSGPTGSGKDMLVYAVCTELGATLFDLTPANIVGKYPGKSGLTMLIHLVTKVARLLQPSIIYMDNAERPFVKKIPKTDRTDPKRLKKDLSKIVKNFVPEDRVMLIGVTNCPWDSDQKLLQQVYQKYLFIPRPDYSTRFAVWSSLLREYSAISWQFDISGLSKISDGYTIGAITATISEIMTIKRMLQLRVHPLSPLELINSLAKRTPVYKEEEEAMAIWWMKTPTCKRRLRAIELLVAEEAEAQVKQANAKR